MIEKCVCETTAVGEERESQGKILLEGSQRQTSFKLIHRLLRDRTMEEPSRASLLSKNLKINLAAPKKAKFQTDSSYIQCTQKHLPT